MVPYYLANLTMTGILFGKVHHDDCHIGDVGHYTWEPLHFSQAMSENIKASKNPRDTFSSHILFRLIEMCNFAPY